MNGKLYRRKISGHRPMDYGPLATDIRDHLSGGYRTAVTPWLIKIPSRVHSSSKTSSYMKQ